jgi:hypothetical protein
VGHVERTDRREMPTGLSYGNMKESDHIKKHTYTDISKMNLIEIGHDRINWIHLAEERDMWRALVNVVITFLVPQCTGNISVNLGTVSFSMTLFHGHNTSTYALVLIQIQITSKLSFTRVYNIPLPLYEMVFGLLNI